MDVDVLEYGEDLASGENGDSEDSGCVSSNIGGRRR